MIRLSPRLVRRRIVALAGNAARAPPEAGEIDLAVGCPRRRLLCLLADNEGWKQHEQRQKKQRAMLFHMSPPECHQAKTVGNNEQRAAFMKEDGFADANPAKDRCQHE